MQVYPKNNSIFDLPYEKALYFDKGNPGKLVATAGEKKLEIDVVDKFPLQSKDHLGPMGERGGIVFFNVASKDGEMFRVGVRADQFAKITLLLVVESLPSLKPRAEAKPITLALMGLTQQEYQSLLKYYNDQKPYLETLTEPLFIKRDVPNLPRSLVYVPNGPLKGMYTLLKTHGTAREVGIGTYNLVTFALSLDADLPLNTSHLKVFRSGKKSKLQSSESDVNKILLNDKDYFVVGVNFNYPGPIRSRTGTEERQRVLNQPKAYIPREENVEKVGYLMDYLEGGELFELIDACRFKLSFLQTIAFALKYTYALSVLHDKYEIVHSDQKTENVFLTREGEPKIGDFGFADKKGNKSKIQGSPFYIAPEIVRAMLDDKEYTLDTPIDVWGLGLIFLSLIGGLKSWQILCRQEENDDWEHMPKELDNIKSIILERLKSKKSELTSFIYVIDKCLQLDPDNRLRALEIVNRLGVIYYALQQGNH